jgi:hypothetical protein
MNRVRAHRLVGVGVGVSVGRVGRVARGAGAATVAALFIGAFGCSSAEKLGGKGASCLLFTDCAVGLVCVETSPSTMECSSDTSGLVMIEEAGAPPEAAVAAPADDAGSSIDGGTVSSVDAGGASPTLMDAGASPVDGTATVADAPEET